MLAVSKPLCDKFQEITTHQLLERNSLYTYHIQKQKYYIQVVSTSETKEFSYRECLMKMEGRDAYFQYLK